MSRILGWITGAVPWWTWAVGGLVLALATTGWLLWGQIERNGDLAATLKGKDTEIAHLRGDLERQEREAKVQREIYDAGDRAVVAAAETKDVVRTRVVTVVREVRVAPDAQAPRPDALGLVLDRLRGFDAGDGGRDPSGAAGAAGSPAARPGPAPGT